ELPELEVFNSADMRDPSLQITRLAQAHALDMLVGPMQLELSRRLDQPLPVPVLALNRSGDGGFNGYQLDLASDQELRQLVELMHGDGHRRLLLLAPAEERWVEPLVLWVQQQVQLRGMKLAGLLRYSANPARLKQQLGQILGVRASQQRANAVRTLMADRHVFSPRRRQDLDAVLLIARPEQGRLLKPLLAFEQAEGLPVYASSHLYSGTPDAVLDRDLDGVRFCDMPWRLRQRQGLASSSVFFALGMDAGSVYRALPQMRAGVPGYFEGETGHLRLEGGRRLVRTLLCAQFNQGVPKPYAWSDGRRYP
ncbi:MAG: penicillin-binding protein activator, partial [Marinobacterium sp.]